jgi:LysM repeat protein
MSGRPKRSIIARIVALVALIGTIVVVYVVVSGSLSIDDNSSSSDSASEQVTVPKNHGDIPKDYTVGDGESLSSIAEKYDISVKRIERLNKGVDPNTLATGVVIKLH